MIEDTIHELLREKQYVVIPHFGALTRSQQPAQISPESQLIQPPVPTVSFDEAHSINDGLLANRLSVRQRTSFSKALAQVNEAVKAWKAQLATGQSLCLSGIGTFHLLNDGTIQMKPRTGHALSPGTYGLAAETLTPVKRSAQGPRKAVAKRKKPVRQAQKQAKPSPILLAPLSILIAVLLLSVGLNVPLYNSSNSNQASFSALIPTNASTGQPDASLTNNSSRTREITGKEKQAAGAVSSTRSSEAYHVIAGSFQSKQNARDCLAVFCQRGYKAKILTDSDGPYRVSVRETSSVNKAMDLANNLRQRPAQPQAWVLKQD
jgi:nucleoid DNA-binding protein